MPKLFRVTVAIEFVFLAEEEPNYITLGLLARDAIADDSDPQIHCSRMSSDPKQSPPPERWNERDLIYLADDLGPEFDHRDITLAEARKLCEGGGA